MTSGAVARVEGRTSPLLRRPVGQTGDQSPARRRTRKVVRGLNNAEQWSTSAARCPDTRFAGQMIMREVSQRLRDNGSGCRRPERCRSVRPLDRARSFCQRDPRWQGSNGACRLHQRPIRLGSSGTLRARDIDIDPNDDLLVKQLGDIMWKLTSKGRGRVERRDAQAGNAFT
jgi:hypothetical protein